MTRETEGAPQRDPRQIDFPYVFRLSKAVKAHDEDLMALTLREPTGDDVLKFGLLDGLDSSQFAPLVTSLAAIPMSTVGKMTARDTLALATVLSRFFQWAALPPA